MKVRSLCFNSTMVLGLSVVVSLVCGCQAGGPSPSIEQPVSSVQAPNTFKVNLETTKGDIVLEIHRDWSPNGVDRFYELVTTDYYKDVVIYRAISGFMFQFGIHGDPAVNKKWQPRTFKDDPSFKGISNTEGYITFAKTPLKNSRSVQTFINFGNNSSLDRDGFTPFGKVVEGMDVIKKINTEYGKAPGEEQGMFQSNGNKFILKKYPRLDIIKSAKIVD